jgi:hypothetical protein
MALVGRPYLYFSQSSLCRAICEYLSGFEVSVLIQWSAAHVLRTARMCIFLLAVFKEKEQVLNGASQSMSGNDKTIEYVKWIYPSPI